ncbi:MAG TPA: STAS domain-containing protein [Acidimicrobiales bacterium]|nr:STAS domain-containing protein [Acidimicrobiales bacterium]
MPSPPTQLEVVERTDGAALVRLSGDLDIVTADDVKGELVALIDGGHRALSLDLSDVGFVDSSGLGVLVAVHRRAESAGGALVIRSTPPQLRRLFEITRLGDLLTVDGD